MLADSDLSSRSVVLMSLGESHHGLGRFHEAIDYYTQALAIHQTTADCFYHAFTLTYLAHSHAALHHLSEAVSCYERALALHRRLKNRYGQAETLIGLAAVLDPRHPRKAQQHRREALNLLDALNAPATDKLRARIAE